MKELIIHWVSNFPDHWAVFLMAMIPITEIRASIPIGITVYDMPAISAFLWSIAGNIIIGALILLLLEPVIAFTLRKNEFLHNLWLRYIDRIKTKNTHKFERWGSLALIAFVAVPLPMTGVFTGAVAASIFQVPYFRAVGLLAMGSVISGCIVSVITLGAISL